MRCLPDLWVAYMFSNCKNIICRICGISIRIWENTVFVQGYVLYTCALRLGPYLANERGNRREIARKMPKHE